MNKDVMFSSATDLWETPQSFFDALNEEFGFETDVCKAGEIQNRREYIEFAAANAIERLTAENAALREKQRWISVTEKTPEYDMPQLALNADGEALIANYAYGEWFDTWGQDVEVTHWMPLPEAPEEHNGKENS